MRLLALIAALAVFALYAQWRHDHPSPGEGPPLGEWLKSLVSRDTDTDVDTDLDPDIVVPAGYRLVPVDEHRTEVEWYPTLDDLPPAVPTDEPEQSRLQAWVADAVDRGVRTKDIVKQGTRLFRVSTRTITRAISAVRTRT